VALATPSPDAAAVPLAAGSALLALAWWSRQARRIHFLVRAVALVLIAWGWARFPRPGPAISQVSILAGLVLGLLGIIPNHAGDPPPAWRPHAQERA